MTMKGRAGYERWMLRALELARRAEGLTRPNPPVGAVVVRGGGCVGEGYHRRAGGPHAEILAFKQAGAASRGATLFVTLEPCCTWGRTPPCTEAVIASGVRRVVVGARDPNPLHAGKGLLKLRAAGIEVVEGVCLREARELIEPFALWMTRRRPKVTLKLGMTLDGRIADRSGRARWITSGAARRRVQALRRRVDAILVGAGTVRADDPHLQPRPARGRRPLRVIVSRTGRVPPGARVFTDDAKDRTILAVPTGRDGPDIRRLERSGVRVWRVPGSRRDVSLASLLGLLGRDEGCLHVLCEGGGGLAEALVGCDLVDDYLFVVAPLVLGAGKAAIAGAGWALKSAPRLRFLSMERCGPDIIVEAVRVRNRC